MAYAGMQSGNYAAGDYYAYQAGSIFSTLGKIAGGVIKTVGGALPGPIGAAAKVVGGVLSGKAKGTAVATVGTFPTQLPSMIPMVLPPNIPRGAPGAVPKAGITGAMERFVPGGQTGYTQPGGPGWHLNKQDGKYGPKGTYWVRNRAMNPGNARALRRAVRREKAFVSLAKRVLRGTGITVSRRSFSSKRRARR